MCSCASHHHSDSNGHQDSGPPYADRDERATDADQHPDLDVHGNTDDGPPDAHVDTLPHADPHGHDGPPHCDANGYQHPGVPVSYGHPHGHTDGGDAHAVPHGNAYLDTDPGVSESVGAHRLKGDPPPAPYAHARSRLPGGADPVQRARGGARLPHLPQRISRGMDADGRGTTPVGAPLAYDGLSTVSTGDDTTGTHRCRVVGLSDRHHPTMGRVDTGSRPGRHPVQHPAAVW